MPFTKGVKMEKLQALIEWWTVQGPVVVGVVLGTVSVLELVVRLTPTTKDDAAVERVGSVIRKFFDMIGVPNYRKGGGQFPPEATKVEEKK